MNQTTKSKCWIGHISWAIDVACCLDMHENVCAGLLFKTKNDAIAAGWDRPSRVEVTVRPL